MFQWLRQVSVDGWRGLGSVFVHSFYSQGSDDQRSASSDPFFDQALTHFGYRGPVIADPAEKGRCLAGLLTATGGLLVLDGLEPLQNPPRDARSGELRDMAVRTLLLTLANAPAGLCVLTTRQELPELKARVGATVAQHPLNRLNLDDGVALLHELEVKGRRDELRAAVKDYHGHAYSLMLLGTYLRNATEDHDIRQRHDFALLDEDKEHDHHAQHIFTTYETYLGPDSPEIALLRLLGFFNRPASRELIDVLRAAKRVVYELDEEAKKAQQARQRMRQLGMDVGSGSEPEPEPQTVEDRLPDAAGPLLELRAADWQRLLRRLAGLRLLSVADDGSLDSHPLLREHFAEELQIQFPDAFQAGHRRLYEHLCGTTAYQPDTLDGLQPLYQAVTHGCLAGRQQEACDEVYFGRILRGASYSTKQLGAVGADLGAVTAFFEESWSRVSPNLSPEVQRWLLNQAAFYLRALGRPGEAIDPMQAGGEKHVAAEDWQNATIAYDNLSELEVTLGRLAGGVADGRLAIDYADRSGNAFRRMGNRTTAAAALHQTGEREDAQALFAEAERLQAERQPELPLLYSLQGFRYVDLILAPAERLVWQVVMNAGEFPALAPKAAGPGIGAALASGSAVSEALAACAEAERRAIQTLQWAVAARVDLLSVALDHLSLARARLYRALLTGDAADPATVGTTRGAVTTALSKLRQASDLGYLPKALLANVLQAGAVAGQLDEARHYLAEAQLIAERGPMPLHLADVQLHRARLFFRDDLAAAQGSLAEARRLIDRHGYHRRDGELADAEEALANWAESHR